MEPTSLSASAIKTYMECSARYQAEYIDRVRISAGGGTAGDLGSLLHECLEWWVTEGRYSTTGSKPLADKCKELAPNYGVDALQVKVATKMLGAWHQRWEEDETPFEVLQAEVKETFLLKIRDAQGEHTVPVNYIWDRVDKLLADGSIRVIDYKSWMKFMTGDEIFWDIQVRIYALAAAIKYKSEQPPFIWVGLDQLRYGVPTVVRFSREDIRDVWAWLKGVYGRILADDGNAETVGPGCRYCVRSTECLSFAGAVKAGTVMTYQSPEDAARKVASINAVLPALQDTKAQLLAYLETHLEESGFLEQRFEGSGVTVKITPRRQRTVDHDAAVAAIGVDMAAKYSTLGVTAIDELLAGPELDAKQKAALSRAVTEGVTTSTNAVFK